MEELKRKLEEAVRLIESAKVKDLEIEAKIVTDDFSLSISPRLEKSGYFVTGYYTPERGAGRDRL